MVWGLKQGGVSLLGQLQPLTHEQWRSSFMRRNQDPRLNERVHRVRALQSTLKVSWAAVGMLRGWALGFQLWLLALASGPRSRFPEPGSGFPDKCWVLGPGPQN